ncbi:MAG: hypothetical protein NWE89_04670 [Candidatus Bathyarchaeota archaeon]|nr:hypothetical protein [Candidatus Bathyarchaeota archaeon]
MSKPKARDSMAGILAAMMLMCSIALLAGCVMWLSLNPAFSLGYDPDDPNMLFKPRSGPLAVTMENTTDSVPEVPPEPSLNQTISVLESRGCTVVKYNMDEYREENCRWVDNAAFIEIAAENELVFLHINEKNEPVLLVRVKKSYVAWRQTE